MISVKKIKLKELVEFVCSEAFETLKNKPISKARAISYAHNPRANKEDVILYMAFLKNELISYRTLLSDTFVIENKEVPFGWLSGNWVAEEHRRKGISTLLFKEVLKDWDASLMYTNYAEASKLVYDKTQQFNLLKELKGVKYYTRFCLADILPKKKRIFNAIKLFWVMADTSLNFILNIRNFFKQQLKEENFSVKINEDWNDSMARFVSNYASGNLFQRSKKELQWIQKYPWVLTDDKTKSLAASYNFSSYAKDFDSKMYTVYSKDGNLIGCFFMTIRNGHVKIPYLYFSEENSKEIAEFIIHKCSKMKVKTIVIYHKQLEEEFNKKLFFVTKKIFTQKYFITNELKELIKKEVEIQSGDGDVVFT